MKKKTIVDELAAAWGEPAPPPHPIKLLPEPPTPHIRFFEEKCEGNRCESTVLYSPRKIVDDEEGLLILHRCQSAPPNRHSPIKRFFSKTLTEGKPLTGSVNIVKLEDDEHNTRVFGVVGVTRTGTAAKETARVIWRFDEILSTANITSTNPGQKTFQSEIATLEHFSIDIDDSTIAHHATSCYVDGTKQHSSIAVPRMPTAGRKFLPLLTLAFPRESVKRIPIDEAVILHQESLTSARTINAATHKFKHIANMSDQLQLKDTIFKTSSLKSDDEYPDFLFTLNLSIDGREDKTELTAAAPEFVKIAQVLPLQNWSTSFGPNNEYRLCLRLWPCLIDDACRGQINIGILQWDRS